MVRGRRLRRPHVLHHAGVLPGRSAWEKLSKALDWRGRSRALRGVLRHRVVAVPGGQAQVRRGEGDRPPRQRGDAGARARSGRRGKRWPARARSGVGCRARSNCQSSRWIEPDHLQPYEEPRDHWIYDKETGAASRAGIRRPASYWYKTERTGSAQIDADRTRGGGTGRPAARELPAGGRAQAGARPSTRRGRSHARPAAALGASRPGAAVVLLPARSG